MGARRLKLVASVGSERSVTLAAVVADLRRLSPEALTRCSRLIQALAHAESVVRRVQADRMRLAEGHAAPAARHAAIDAQPPSPIHDDRYQRAASSRQ